jgi:hypothetical protein
MVRIATFLTLLLLAAAAPGAHRVLGVEQVVVAPLADPTVVPGVARCTSDGVCTVTDESGTRSGTPLLFAR